MRKLLNFIFIVFFISLGIFLLNTQSGYTKQTSQRKSTLVAASSNNFPPMNVLGKDGNLTGFGRELADAVIKEIGGEIKHIHSAEWVEVLDWLKTGKADFIHDTGYTQERDQFLDYSVPIIEMPEVIFVRPDEYSITDFDSLKGRTVACVNKHISHLYLKQFPKISLFVVKTPVEGIYELISGKVDAFVYPKQIVLYIVQNLRLKDKIKVLGDPLRSLSWSMVVKQGNEEVLQRLNEGIAKVRKSGQYDHIYNKWWGEKILSGYTKDQLYIFTIMTTSICLAVILSITFFLFSRRLKKDVEEKTFSLTQEIAERQAVETKLKKEKKFTTAVLENIEDGIVACDQDGVLSLFNSATRTFHCLPVKSIPADEWAQHYDLFLADGSTPMQKKDVPLFRALKGEYVKDVEMIIAPKQGQNRILLASGQPLRDEHENLIGAVVSMHDVTASKKAENALKEAHNELELKVKHRTHELQQSYEKLRQETLERKEMENKLLQAHKMESIGTLAGGIAHDFNNILFPIVGHTEMLLEDASEDSPFRDSLNQIYTGAMRASELVKQILTFSRQRSSELKLMKLQPIIKEALKLIRSTIPTTINIKQNINSDCGVVKADPTQIHQIIMNLATNAYHAMEEAGGELKVSLKEIQLSEYDMIAPEMVPGAYACLSVTDTGKGMNKELIGKIFDPFFTTKEKGKGTGMGLSVIHGIVKSMSGAIQVYSEPGKGTEFHVYLPVEKSLSEKQITNSKAEIQGGTEQILLVDDEEAILSMEKLMLERLGYQVTSRTSSIEALEVFRDIPDKFDLVITDMAMPNMPGDKLSAELTKIRPGIPVLLCTGFSETMSEEKAVSQGIKGFLWKPIIMKDLAKKIRDVLDETPKLEL